MLKNTKLQNTKFHISRGKRVRSFNSFNFCNFCIATFVTLLTFVTFVTIYTFVTSGTFETSVAYAGIAGSKHDLSATGPGTIRAQTETQKCVFCHTPHHSSTAGPLWNRNLSAVANYTLPSQTEWLSLLSAPGQPDRGAKLCLSCHDGTVAIGSVLNMPGPGMAGTISMLGVTAEGYMPCSPTDLTCLGIDISGHHPVSIAYNDNLYNAKTTQCNNCQSALPIKAPASVTSPVRLRPTDNRYPPGGAQSLGVQCSSCHNPHNNSYGKFLVMAYDGENLCYACHYKCTATCE